MSLLYGNFQRERKIWFHFFIILMIQPLWNLIILSISYVILIHYVTSEIEIIELVEIQLVEKFLSFDFNSQIYPVSK